LPPEASLESIGRAIELYRSAGSDVDLARALTFAVRPQFMQFEELHAGTIPEPGVAEPAEAYAAEAVAILERYPPGADLARAVSQQAWMAMMTGDAPRAAGLAERASRLGDATGDHWAACHALNTQGVLQGRSGEALAALDEARQRAEEHGYPDEELRALGSLSDAAFEMLDPGLATDLARRMRDTAIRYDMPSFESFAQVQLAHYQFWAGDWETAEHALVGLLSFSEVDAGWALGSLQARLGRHNARPTLERAWSLVRAFPDIERQALVAGAFAEYLWLVEEDDHDLVAGSLEVTKAMVGRAGPTAGLLPMWLWKLGHLPSTPEWIDERWRLIEVRPLEAAALWQAHGFPYQQGLALMHADEQPQVEALRIFERLGASVTAARLRRLLADGGVRVPRGKAVTTRRHPAGLTVRQAEVLELLAEGCTSPEIADRLFISPRTAESHVAAVLMKLDVADRAEAVAAARAQGLLEAG
jgi:DNA-binding CsgD family transcriptional regulator